MSGAHPRVIGYLQRALNHELYAVQQFTLQAVRVETWGMKQVAMELRRDVVEELKHAETFIQSMYALDVTPRVGQTPTPQIGRDYTQVLLFGLATEAEAVRLYKEATLFCERIGDRDHREVFSRILTDEVQHFQDCERRLAGLQSKLA